MIEILSAVYGWSTLIGEYKKIANICSNKNKDLAWEAADSFYLEITYL